MSIGLIYLFFLSSIVTCLDYAILVQIANNIEMNITKTVFPKTYTIQIEDFEVVLSGITPLFRYDSRKITNHPIGNERIHYNLVYLSIIFNITIFQKGKYTTWITNQLIIEETLSEIIFTRDADNSFSFSIGKTKKVNFKKSYLFFYKLFKPFVEQGKEIMATLGTSITDFFAFVLSKYPLSLAEYYFKDFIQEIIRYGPIPYTPSEVSRDMTIAVYNVVYKRKERIDGVTNVFHEVTAQTIIDDHFSSHFANVEIKMLEFGKNMIAIRGVAHDWYFESFMFAFVEFVKSMYKNHNYEDKFQDVIW